LPGMSHPLQVKLADSELKAEDRKLFVGLIPQSASEDYLRSVFSPYGALEEVIIMRTPDGTSRCCAFVKYMSRADAQAAIMALNGTVTLEGARGAMQVRFAETDKEKMQKRMQTPQGGFQQPFGNPMAAFGGMPFGGMGAMSPMGGMAGMAGMAGLAGMSAMPNVQGGQHNQAGYYGQPGMGTPDMSAAFNGVQQYSGEFLQDHQSTSGYGQQPYAQQTAYGAAPARAGSGVRPAQGPEGANLFIFNIPAEYNDSALATLFMPFGNIVSTKVMIDPATGQSKRCGFVSFDNVTSAQTAIQAMNGYMLNGNQLKVSVKRSNNAPY